MGYTDRGEEGGPRKPSLVDIGRVENIVGSTLCCGVSVLRKQQQHAGHGGGALGASAAVAHFPSK